MSDLSRRITQGFLFVGAMLITILVSRYLTMDPEVYFPEQKDIYQAHPISLICHVVGGMIALALGPFQFIGGIRKKYQMIHEIMGRIYAVGCIVGAIGGLFMATRAYGGFPGGLGFGMLAVLWIVTIVLAVARAREHKITEHREWVIRSYALTLAALSLRIYLPVHGVLLEAEIIDLPFIQMFRAVGWLCWVPNLIIAEWYINSTRRRLPVATPG